MLCILDFIAAIARAVLVLNKPHSSKDEWIFCLLVILFPFAAIADMFLKR